MKKEGRRIACISIMLVSLLLAGCDGNVGIGLSVGVPIGNHGHMSVGGTRWR